MWPLLYLIRSGVLVTTLTDSNVDYLFVDLLAGVYSVVESVDDFVWTQAVVLATTFDYISGNYTAPLDGDKSI